MKNDKIIEDVFRYIYNQQYQKADSMLQSQNDKIEPFYFDILTIDLSWWQYIHSRSDQDSHHFNSVLKSFKQSKTDTPESQIKQLVMLSYQLRFELKRYNIIGAIRLRFEIKKLLEEIKTSELDYSKNRIELFHLYNALFSYFDNILNPFFSKNIRNERESALLEIEVYTRADDLIISTLSSYFLGKIYLNIEKEPAKGNKLFRTLAERYPQNAIFRELLAESAKKS